MTNISIFTIVSLPLEGGGMRSMTEGVLELFHDKGVTPPPLRGAPSGREPLIISPQYLVYRLLFRHNY